MWEILKRKVERFGADEVFISIVLGVCLLFTVMLGGFCFGDKTPQCYYLSSSATSAGIAHKIKSSSNWAEDVTAFASSDPDLVLVVFDTLPKCGACEE